MEQNNYGAELGFRWHISLVTADQLELPSHNPLFRPKSEAIRYLTGPEITHPGTELVDLISGCGTRVVQEMTRSRK